VRDHDRHDRIWAAPVAAIPPGTRSRPDQEEDAASNELVQRVRGAAAGAVPEGATVLVVSDGDDELLKLGGQQRGWRFPRDTAGDYNGKPADDKEAIAQLEALRAKGAGYLLLPEPSFWWLDYYKEFAAYLEGHAQRVHRDVDCIIYELAGPK